MLFGGFVIITELPYSLFALRVFIRRWKIQTCWVNVLAGAHLRPKFSWDSSTTTARDRPCYCLKNRVIFMKI